MLQHFQIFMFIGISKRLHKIHLFNFCICDCGNINFRVLVSSCWKNWEIGYRRLVFQPYCAGEMTSLKDFGLSRYVWWVASTYVQIRKTIFCSKAANFTEFTHCFLDLSGNRYWLAEFFFFYWLNERNLSLCLVGV